MADKVFIPSRYSSNDVLKLSSLFYDAGVVVTHLEESPSVRSFARTLRPGDRVVIHSFEVFGSLVEMMLSVRLFFRQGAAVHSILEPEISEGLDPRVVGEVLIELLSTLFDGAGVLLVDAAAERLSEVYRVERLRRTVGMNLSSACRASGCTLNTYRYYERVAKSGAPSVVLTHGTC